MAWVRQAKQQSEFHEKLTIQIRELSRSKPFADLQQRSRELAVELIRNSEEDRHRLDGIVERTFQCGVIQPISETTVRSAIQSEMLLPKSGVKTVIVRTQ
jgi:hypothetical protein